EAEVEDPDRLAAVQAEVVQGQGQLAAVALAGAARDQVGQHAGQAEQPRRVVAAPAGDEEVHRRRADVRHALAQERQAVGEGVLVELLGHGHLESARRGAGAAAAAPGTALYRTLVRRKPSPAYRRMAASLWAVASSTARPRPLRYMPCSACKMRARPRP